MIKDSVDKIMQKCLKEKDASEKLQRVPEAAQGTQRRRRGAERLLRDGHFWFAGDAIIVHDEKGRIIDCNEQAAKSFDYSREELLRLGIKDITLPAEGDEAPWKIAPWGKLTAETVGVRKDGTSFSVEVCVRHEIRNDSSLFIAVIRDATKRKEAENEIKDLLSQVQKEKEKFSRLIDSMNDEVWVTDNQLNIVLSNPAARSTFGLINAEIELKDLIKKLEILRPDGTPRPEAEAPPMRALAGEFVKNFEEIVRIPSTGQVYHRQVSSSPVRDAEGRITGTVSVVRDITEQKTMEKKRIKSAEEMKAIFDVLPVGLSILNKKGDTVRVNRSLERILGISEEDLLSGKDKKRRYLRGDGTPMPAEEMPSVISRTERRVVENAQVGVVKGDEKIVWTLVSSAPLPDGGAVVATKDFTRQKKTLEILEWQRKEVEDANAALRVLLKQREQDKSELEQDVMSNINKLVMPHLDLLGGSVRSAEMKAHLDIIRAALNNIMSSFSTAHEYKLGSLSPKEIQIAHMVKEGRRDKEIAGLLNLSEPTIRAHRRNIRKKLGLTGRKVNLRSYLSISPETKQ